MNTRLLAVLLPLAFCPAAPAARSDEPALPRSPLINPVADTPTVRTVADVGRIPRDVIRVNHPFELSGQVLVDNRRTGQLLCTIEDRPGVLVWSTYATGDTCRSGDLFTAAGYAVIESEEREPTLFATNMTRRGSAPLPETPLVSGFQINEGAPVARTASVRGVLASAIQDELDNQWNWITLKTPNGKVYASVAACDFPLEGLRSLVDAEVVVRGLASRTGGWKKVANGILELFNRGAITVEKPPAANPFDLPEELTPNKLHRQRIVGVQVAATREHLYLRSDNGRFISVAPTTGTDAALNGHRISAVGFAESWHNGQVMLVEAIVRDEGPAADGTSAPHPLDTSRFFIGKDGHRYANPEYFGNAVSIEGRVTDSPDDVRSSGVFHLDCNGRAVRIDVSALVGKTALPAPDSRVRIVGTCLMSFEHNPNTALFFPRFQGFTVVPSSDADIVILANPPWWTPVRLLSVILALLGVLVVFAVWNRALRIAAERRGHALAKERLAHTRSEVKVEERTRLAVELHDSLSQTLTGIALQLDAAQRANANGNAAVERFLVLARQMLGSCRKELQCCLWDLRSRTFEEKDMTEAIQRAIAPHLDRATASVRFNVPRRNLSETSAHTILRIIRELVVNAIRHGHATRLKIAGEFHGGTISFSVRDNGDGFDPQTVAGPSTGHFGLQGIRERLRNFNGTLTAESRPGAGARFAITLQTDSAS